MCVDGRRCAPLAWVLGSKQTFAIHRLRWPSALCCCVSSTTKSPVLQPFPELTEVRRCYKWVPLTGVVSWSCPV